MALCILFFDQTFHLNSPSFFLLWMALLDFWIRGCWMAGGRECRTDVRAAEGFAKRKLEELRLWWTIQSSNKQLISMAIFFSHYWKVSKSRSSMYVTSSCLWFNMDTAFWGLYGGGNTSSSNLGLGNLTLPSSLLRYGHALLSFAHSAEISQLLTMPTKCSSWTTITWCILLRSRIEATVSLSSSGLQVTRLFSLIISLQGS